MTEILEAIRKTKYNRFSFHVVSKYREEFYPIKHANMTIDAY
jgi:23S rRNA maturation-related 3'-5' exoribonuclease YhaM